MEILPNIQMIGNLLSIVHSLDEQKQIAQQAQVITVQICLKKTLKLFYSLNFKR